MRHPNIVFSKKGNSKMDDTPQCQTRIELEQKNKTDYTVIIELLMHVKDCPACQKEIGDFNRYAVIAEYERFYNGEGVRMCFCPSSYLSSEKPKVLVSDEWSYLKSRIDINRLLAVLDYLLREFRGGEDVQLSYTEYGNKVTLYLNGRHRMNSTVEIASNAPEGKVDARLSADATALIRKLL